MILEAGTTAPPIRYGEMAPRISDGPVDLRSLIAGEGDLELEIGFGRGGFLYERAAAAPESRIIGIEIKNKYAFLVSERLKKRGILHVQAYSGDAREILSRTTCEGALARVFVHFPDPWWKKKHLHRRVLDDTLLVNVARLLRADGELFVQTDVLDRAELLVKQLREHPGLRLQGNAEGFVDSNIYGARSNREVRAEEDGLPIYRILARKKA